VLLFNFEVFKEFIIGVLIFSKFLPGYHFPFSLIFFFIFAALLRGSGMQWSFSNKVSAVPQFLSFRSAQEDRPRRNVNDSIPSSGFMTISTADAFDSNQKPYSGLIQVC
jgi:hypothetical protein